MSNTTKPKGPAALDLATLAADRSGALLTDLDWPTPYVDYAFLSNEMVDKLVASARAAAATPELEAAVEAKLADAVSDLALIARLALDLRHTRAAARQPLYSRTDSPWLRFLDEGAIDTARVIRQRAWHYRKSRGAFSELKRRVHRWRSDAWASLSPTADRYDVLSRNSLLDEHLGRDGARRVDISPNYRDWPAPSATPEPVRDVVTAMTEAFAAAAIRAAGNDSALATSARALSEPVIAGHLGKAWSDLGRIRRLITERRAGAVLAGGTPKHIGRLFAWQYKQLGRTVFRFGHGGERAFYDDYSWSLSELPWCDRYFCHSHAEATHLSRRCAERRMTPAGPDDIAFEGLGSRKHQAIRAASGGRRRAPRTGTVMYVAGGYLGEVLADFPTRKPPDALYFEWQAWLLKAIRALGYKVVTKVHPKGVLHEAMLLRPFSDRIVDGYFDCQSHDADCYVFDFAGTAFFDALASDRGVVLIDMGTRPRDANSFDDLNQRCEVVTCEQGPGNRFRLDIDHLGEAIERAATAREWPEGFFETYFHG